MMPLGMANVGDVNIIKRINGRDEVRQHLAELGFVVGAEIKVVSDLGGNLILNVKESRVALDKTMAMRIYGLTGRRAFSPKLCSIFQEEEAFMKTLKDIKVGEHAVIEKLHGEGALKRRIMDMGLTKGTEVYVRKVAPLGDPMELTVRGYELSVRRADAELIEVR